MSSRLPVPNQSKIPKLRTGSDSSSSRKGPVTQSTTGPAKSLKSHSAVSGQRKPISFRLSTTAPPHPLQKVQENSAEPVPPQLIGDQGLAEREDAHQENEPKLLSQNDFIFSSPPRTSICPSTLANPITMEEKKFEEESKEDLKGQGDTLPLFQVDTTNKDMLDQKELLDEQQESIGSKGEEASNLETERERQSSFFYLTDKEKDSLKKSSSSRVATSSSTNTGIHGLSKSTPTYKPTSGFPDIIYDGEEQRVMNQNQLSCMTKLSPKKNNPATVDVLYAPNPIRNDSISSVTTPESMKKNSYHQSYEMTPSSSPTYLQLYRQRKESGIEKRTSWSTSQSENAMDSSDKVNQPDSMEWDYSTMADQLRHTCTQTSVPSLKTIAVGSFPVFESFSKESLLEETKPPSIIGLTTPEQEDSENDKVTVETPVLINEQVEDENHADIKTHYEDSSSDFESCTEENETIEVENIFSAEIDGNGQLTQENLNGTPLASGKKAKTIFSVDLPVTKSRVQTGPGENGDGHQVIPRRSEEKKVAFSNTTILEGGDEEEMKELFFSSSENKTSPVKSKTNFAFTSLTSTNASILENWRAENIPKLHTDSAGRMEIRPSPVPLTTEDVEWDRLERKLSIEKSSTEKVAEKTESVEEQVCKALIPKGSTLILTRYTRKRKNYYQGAIQIFNGTSFLHGFKVFCNSNSLYTLTITPKMGLIPPHSQVTVDVKTKCFIASHCCEAKLSVNVFRSFCDDKDNLQDYFQKLSEQHPELIQKQNIDRLIIWNTNDLPGMMIMLNSIKDAEERENLKKQLHEENCKQLAANASAESKVILSSVSSNMLLANRYLREVFHELANIRNALHMLLFISTCIFGFNAILPLMTTNAEIEVDDEKFLSESDLPWYSYIRHIFQDSIDFFKRKLVTWDSLKKSIFEKL